MPLSPAITASVAIVNLPAHEWRLRHLGVAGVELVTDAADLSGECRLTAPGLAELHDALLEMADLVAAHARHPSGRAPTTTVPEVTR